MFSSYGKFNVLYAEQGKNQRIGQFFVNRYIKNAWPELFHQNDPDIAKKMIQNWLFDNHYYEELPLEVKHATH